MAIMWENVCKYGNYVGKCRYVWQLCGKMSVSMAIMWENVGKYGNYVGKCR